MKKEIEFIFQDQPSNREKKLLEKHAKELIEFSNTQSILRRERKREIYKTKWEIIYSKTTRTIIFRKLDREKLKADSLQAKKDSGEALKVHVIKGSKK